MDGANQHLVSLANERGGHDNITIVTIEIPSRTLLERMASSRRLFRTAVVSALLLAIIVFAGLVIGFNYLNNRDGNFGPTLPAFTVTAQPTQGLPAILSTQLQPPTLTPTRTPTLTPISSPTATIVPGVAPVLATATPWPTNTVFP